MLTGNGRIWAFNHNGTLADRFPVPVYERETGLSSPVLGDVDGDGSADIVVQNSDGNVEAFHADGRSVDGFPLAT